MFVVVAVAFVIAILCDDSGSIKVSLFSGLAKPGYGVKVKLPISVIARKSKTTKLIL